jgi:hypothetical protein
MDAMRFIDIPTEQTTAVTDVILAVCAFVFSIIVCRIGRSHDRKKALIWTWAFGLLALASALGAAAHGIAVTKETNFIIWQPINLALGLTIALFVTGVMYDMREFSLSRGYIPVFLGVGVIFYLITLLVNAGFFIFILYESIAMIFALVSYIILAIRKKHKSFWLMAAGIFVTIIAAVIQAAGTIHVKVIWEFDQNGLFHILQVVGLVFLFSGVYSELLSRKFTENELS